MYRLDYEPRGFDFCELAYMLGVIDNLNEEGYPAGFDEDTVVKELKAKLGQIIPYPQKDEEMEKCVRKFLNALIEAEHSYWKPVWEGLLKVEEPYTLYQATSALVECMWT